MTVVVGFEFCRGGVTGPGGDLAVEAPLVESGEREDRSTAGIRFAVVFPWYLDVAVDGVCRVCVAKVSRAGPRCCKVLSAPIA